MKRYIRSAVNPINTLDVWERVRLARGSRTSTRDLALLAKDKSYEVRALVALNPNTSSDVLTHLAKSTHPNVLCYVAANPHTPSDALETIWKKVDYTWDLYLKSNAECSLANNPNTPAYIINELAHVWGTVGDLARANPNYSGGQG